MCPMAIGPIGNVDTGGNGVQGVWDTWAIRPTGAKWYGGRGHIGDRDTGQWGTGGMGHMGNVAPRGMQYRGMGHMHNRCTGSMGYKGYGSHG